VNDRESGVRCYIYHFCFVVFAENERCRCWMGAGVDEELGDGVLAVCNGMKFKVNNLVAVIVGTGAGVRADKTEPFKGQFKGVVETERGIEFLVRPLVGSGKGRCLQIPQHRVFRIQAFGTCVLGTRTTRFFFKLQPAQKDQCVSLQLSPLALLPSCLICSFSHCCLPQLRVAQGKCRVACYSYKRTERNAESEKVS
jgi:hypothetical protein